MMCLPASMALAFAPGGGSAGIEYVGGQTSGRVGDTAPLVVSFALTGGLASVPAAGDLVVITCSSGSPSGVPPSQAIGGFTPIGDLTANSGTSAVSLNVSWKFMTGTPDTQFTVPSSGSANNAQTWAVQVFRGVDPAADPGATDTSDTSVASASPNPPSITPTVAGSWVLVCAAGACSTGAVYTPPTDFVTDFLTTRINDAGDSIVGSGYWSGWSAGAVDPGVYGNWSSTGAWAAYTLVLPPA